MTTATPRFRIYRPRALKHEGFAGTYVTVDVSHDGLALRGDEAGALQVPWSQVERARIGFTEAKYGPIYEARIWLAGRPSPLVMFPVRDNRGAYADGMRILAQELQALGRLPRVTSGTSPFEAILGPALMGLLAAASIAAAAIAMEPPQWWHFVVIPFAPVALTVYLTWRAVTTHWPRPLESLAALEKQLPR